MAVPQGPPIPSSLPANQMDLRRQVVHRILDKDHNGSAVVDNNLNHVAARMVDRTVDKYVATDHLHNGF